MVSQFIKTKDPDNDNMFVSILVGFIRFTICLQYYLIKHLPRDFYFISVQRFPDISIHTHTHTKTDLND